MKIKSHFSGPLCPTCKKSSVGQGGNPDKPWSCIFCPASICVWCFWEHTKLHDTDRDKELIRENEVAQ